MSQFYQKIRWVRFSFIAHPQHLTLCRFVDMMVLFFLIGFSLAGSTEEDSLKIKTFEVFF